MGEEDRPADREGRRVGRARPAGRSVLALGGAGRAVAEPDADVLGVGREDPRRPQAAVGAVHVARADHAWRAGEGARGRVRHRRPSTFWRSPYSAGMALTRWLGVAVLGLAGAAGCR